MRRRHPRQRGPDLYTVAERQDSRLPAVPLANVADMRWEEAYDEMLRVQVARCGRFGPLGLRGAASRRLAVARIFGAGPRVAWHEVYGGDAADLWLLACTADAYQTSGRRLCVLARIRRRLRVVHGASMGVAPLKIPAELPRAMRGHILGLLKGAVSACCIERWLWVRRRLRVVVSAPRTLAQVWFRSAQVVRRADLHLACLSDPAWLLQAWQAADLV